MTSGDRKKKILKEIEVLRKKRKAEGELSKKEDDKYTQLQALSLKVGRILSEEERMRDEEKREKEKKILAGVSTTSQSSLDSSESFSTPPLPKRKDGKERKDEKTQPKGSGKK